MSKRQVVVRTFPNGWINPTANLQHYLSEGYIVVMVNKIQSKECENLEYILEKEINKERKEDENKNI